MIHPVVYACRAWLPDEISMEAAVDANLQEGNGFQNGHLYAGLAAFELAGSLGGKE